MSIPPPLERKNRIVLTELDPQKNNLNLIVEYHFLDLHKYEVTVITAMRKNNFQISDNQYCVQFDNDVSYLFVNKNKKITEIDSF